MGSLRTLNDTKEEPLGYHIARFDDDGSLRCIDWNSVEPGDRYLAMEHINPHRVVIQRFDINEIPEKYDDCPIISWAYWGLMGFNCWNGLDRATVKDLKQKT
jgi:hypothetical protein